MRYHANKEEYARKNAEWFSKNRERARARIRKYQLEHVEMLRAYRQERHRKNKAFFNEKSKEWRKKNPEKSRQSTHARRARIAGQGGKYTPEDIARIKVAQRGRCAVCREVLPKKFHRDHIIPISAGGSNEARNIQLTCGPCNLSKRAKDPITFMQERGFLL